MRKRLPTAMLILVLIGSAWLLLLSNASSVQVSSETGNHEASYTFAVQNGYYQSDHVMYLSIMPSLIDYYEGKSHALNSLDDYPKFVTPDVVSSIADNIRNITRDTRYDDEEFANAVLAIVRQIPYVRSDAKYPVETLADNKADCDGLSILAASIMKAGGLDVVLIFYDGISPSHMNIGVSLESMPVSHAWWTAPSGIDYDNKTYWIAECTSLADWTVGTKPTLLTSNKPKVIPLETCEKKSPASISSSSNPLHSSSISINLSTKDTDVGDNNVRTINITGSISPAFPNESVAFYFNQAGLSPNASVTSTDDFGNYALLWNVSVAGTYIVKTSWSGRLNFSGSDSDALTVFIDAQQPVVEASSDFPGDYSFGLRSWADSASYSVWLGQNGVEFLKGIFTGPNVALSGDFMVLSDGHEVSLNETTITIPAHQVRYWPARSRQPVIVDVPEQTITVPGAELLNGEFGFILKSDDNNNYTASVKLFTGDEYSQISQTLNQSNVLFMNASNIVAKNAWYKTTIKVTSAGVAVQVFDANGTLLNNLKSGATTTRYGEFGLLMTYPIGQVFAFKNLKVEALGQTPTQIVQNQPQNSGIDFLIPYVKVSLLVGGSVLAILTLVGRKRRSVASGRGTEEVQPRS